VFVPARKAPIGVARDRACSDPPRGPPPLIAPGSIPTPTAVTLPPPLHPIPPNQLQPGSVETDLLPPHAAGKNLSSSSHLRLHPHTPPSHPLVHHPHTPPSHHHPLTPPGTHHHHPHTPPNSHALAPPPHHPHTPPSHPLVPHHPHTPPASHSLTSHTPPSHTPPVHHPSVHPSTTPPTSLYHHTSSQQHASLASSVQRTNGNLTPGRSSACTKDQPGIVTTHTTTPASSGFVRPFEDSFPQQHGSNRRSPIIPPPPSSSHSNSSPGDSNSITKIHHSQQPPYHPSGLQAGTAPCNSQQASPAGTQDAGAVPGGRSVVSHQHRGPSTNTQSVKENCGSANKTAVNLSENSSGSSVVVRKLSSTSPSRGCSQLDGTCHSQTMASSPTTTTAVDHAGASQQQPSLQIFQQPVMSQMLAQPSPSSSRMSPNNVSHQSSPYHPQPTQPNISQHQSSQIPSQQQSSVHHSFVHTSVPSHHNHLQAQSTTLHNPSNQSQQQIPVSHQHLVNSSLPSSSANSIQPSHQALQLNQTTAQLPPSCVSSQQGSMSQTSVHVLNSASGQHQGSANLNSSLHPASLLSSNQHHGSLLPATAVIQSPSSSSLQHQATQNSSSHLQGPLTASSQLQGSSQTIMNSAPICSTVPSCNAVALVASNQSSAVLAATSGNGPSASSLGTVPTPAAVLNVPDAAKVLAAVSTNKEGATNMSVWDYHYLSRSITNHRVSTKIIIFKCVPVSVILYHDSFFFLNF